MGQEPRCPVIYYISKAMEKLGNFYFARISKEKASYYHFTDSVLIVGGVVVSNFLGKKKEKT